MSLEENLFVRLILDGPAQSVGEIILFCCIVMLKDSLLERSHCSAVCLLGVSWSPGRLHGDARIT